MSTYLQEIERVKALLGQRGHEWGAINAENVVRM